ncbi:hydrogenase maturation nickel metallochaperone HypA [Chromatium okenii]|jgi:hydrogenase nickel incorporation protein HypA/HybF|uniref:Hydrogenase maturation factor HypA n=1 Tax=Chromatium okenii TaxID=61644 RepID=A0A2S7XS98_9GAMM|nr:hydrogenase maturation nickel metallochaperone HypA [Chromatium okenii]MBV5310048.1 hydrogenase maturation nickel metallochaperone HypA [Chromatium okenii]PQJ96610.1 hydrogenase nickel incorporation protein HypA [Chromatium okenii]
MHELSLCQALLDQVTQIAAEHGATSVTRIVLKIGPLSGVEAVLLQHAYPLVAVGTCAEHAELVIESAAIRVACQDCGAETVATPNRLFCSICASTHTRLISGNELLLAHLELTVPDEIPALPH